MNMSKHLFGIVLTPFGTAANNRGESEGNITTLQKLVWNGETHSTVSAEAIRSAVRYYWQMHGLPVNRSWNEDKTQHLWKDRKFNDTAENYIDDDVLGFMSAEGAKEEANAAETPSRTNRERKRGTTLSRRSRLEVTRAISLTPWSGDITFNAASVGATPSASSTQKDPVPYGTEVHATRYQYGFALTPEHLEKKERVFSVIDAIVGLSEVAGNQSRFLFDFSPEAIVFRWTDDFAPRMLYGFELDGTGAGSIPVILKRVDAGDIDGRELVIGGPVSGVEGIKSRGAALFGGVKGAAEEIRSRVKRDLGLE